MAVKTADQYYKENPGRLQEAQNRLSSPVRSSQERLDWMHNSPSGSRYTQQTTQAGRDFAAKSPFEKIASITSGTIGGGVTPGSKEDLVMSAIGDMIQNATAKKRMQGMETTLLGNAMYSGDADIVGSDMAEFAQWSHSDQELLKSASKDDEFREFASMNPELFGSAYGTISNDTRTAKKQLSEKYGEDRTNQMIESYRRAENAVHAESAKQKGEEFGEKHGILAGVAAAPGRVVGGIAGGVDRLMHPGKGDDRFTSADPNRTAGIIGDYAKGVAQGNENRITLKQNPNSSDFTKGANRFIKQGVYGAATSATESTTRMLLAGGNKNLALGIMAVGAYDDAFDDATRRGASPERAATYALLVAAAETAGEKLPLDKWVDTFGAKHNWKNIAKGIANTIGVEVPSELLTEVAEDIADKSVMQDKSEINLERKRIVGDLIQSGATEKEANEQADGILKKQTLRRYGLTTLTAALSGGISTGQAALLGEVNNRFRGTQNDTQEISPDIDAASPDATAEENQVIKQAEQEAVAEALEAPQEAQQVQQASIEKAVEQVVNGGTVTNKTAEAILADPVAVQQMEADGVKLDGTKAQNRRAVKEYIQESVTATQEAPVSEQEIMDAVAQEIAPVPQETGDIQALQAEYDSISQQLNDAVTAQRNGEITADEMIQKQNELRERQDEIQEQMYELQGDDTQEEFSYDDELDDTPAEDFPVDYDSEQEPTAEPVEQETPPTIEGAQQEDTQEDENDYQPKQKQKDGYDRARDYEPLLENGRQRDRKGDVRPVDVPTTDKDGKVVAQSVGNIYGSQLTSDQFIDRIERLTAEGKVSHDILHNKDSLNASVKRITRKGIPRTVQEIVDVAESGRTSAEDMSDAIVLYEYLNNDSSDIAQDMAQDVFVAMTQMGTSGGRSSQLMSLFRKADVVGMFKRMSPDAQVDVVKKQIDKAVQKMVKERFVKDGDYSIDPEMLSQYKAYAEAYQNAKGEEAKAKALADMDEQEQLMRADVASRLNTTMKAKWDAWRYMSMLGNVKTQVRNVVGNASFMPYKAAKDLVGTAIEKAIPKEQRTKAVLTAKDSELVKWAKADGQTDHVKSMLKGSHKTGDQTKNDITDNVKVFKNKQLEAVRAFTEKIPEGADMIFKSKHYQYSLAGFLKARGYTAQDVQSGKVSADVLDEGRVYAVQEAMKATFNDSNAFSDFMASFGRRKDSNIFAKGVNMLMEGVMPFRRTPANIVARFAEYSPVGVLKTGYDAATKLRSGDITAATLIDELSANLTGTAAVGLGYALASGLFSGIKLTGSNVDDDEKRKGHQEYAIEVDLPGMDAPISYKIDWAAPANLPLFVGANIHDSLNGDGEENVGVSAFTKILNVGRNALEPMLSLSMLSSLNDVIESAKWAEEGEALYTILASMATSYLNQGIPSLFRQIDSAVAPNKQTTYTTTKDPVTKDLQERIANTPGLYNVKTGEHLYKTDSINAWGVPTNYGSPLERVFNTAVNPGKVMTLYDDKVEQEIARLNEAQSHDVSPKVLSRDVRYDDQNGKKVERQLTADEYKKAQTEKGQTSHRLIADLTASESYNAMTDEMKAKAVSYVYEYATAKALGNAVNGHPGVTSAWMKDMGEDEANAIVTHVITGTISNAYETATGAWKKGREDIEPLVKMYDQIGEMPKTVIEMLPDKGQPGYMKACLEAGVPSETFVDLYGDYWHIDQQEGVKSGRKATEWAYIVDKSMQDGELTGAQASTMKTKMKYWSMVPAEASTYNKMKDAGLDIEDALNIDESIRNYDDPSNAEKMTAIDKTKGLTTNEKWEAFKATFPKPQEGKTNGNYRIDIVKETGYTPENYATAYTGYLDTNGSGKKADRIAGIRKHTGWSYSECSWFYHLFAGHMKP